MKFNRVNDNKLQIIISRDDLLERDLKKWDLVPYNPNSQRIFQEILDEAYEACGFEVGRDAQLMIEAYPMTGESMIITVTKVGNGANKGLLDLDLEALERYILEELGGVVDQRYADVHSNITFTEGELGTSEGESGSNEGKPDEPVVTEDSSSTTLIICISLGSVILLAAAVSVVFVVKRKSKR